MFGHGMVALALSAAVRSLDVLPVFTALAELFFGSRNCKGSMVGSQKILLENPYVSTEREMGAICYLYRRLRREKREGGGGVRVAESRYQLKVGLGCPRAHRILLHCRTASDVEPRLMPARAFRGGRNSAKKEQSEREKERGSRGEREEEGKGWEINAPGTTAGSYASVDLSEIVGCRRGNSSTVSPVSLSILC